MKQKQLSKKKVKVNQNEDLNLAASEKVCMIEVK